MTNHPGKVVMVTQTFSHASSTRMLPSEEGLFPFLTLPNFRTGLKKQRVCRRIFSVVVHQFTSDKQKFQTPQNTQRSQGSRIGCLDTNLYLTLEFLSGLFEPIDSYILIS